MDNIGDDELVKYYQEARGFVFASEEDFGIVPIEAMACSKPVITYGEGGAAESVINGKTGIHFPDQTAQSLNDAINIFEKTEFDSTEIRKRAEEFSEEIFINKFSSLVNRLLDER